MAGAATGTESPVEGRAGSAGELNPLRWRILAVLCALVCVAAVIAGVAVMLQK